MRRVSHFEKSGILKRFTLDKRVSVATAQTSLYLVTSHATEPSKSLTRETGSVARRRAYSAGGSRPEARLNGKEGGSAVVILRVEKGYLRFGVILENLSRRDVEIMEEDVSCSVMLQFPPLLARLNQHFIFFELFWNYVTELYLSESTAGGRKYISWWVVV